EPGIRSAAIYRRSRTNMKRQGIEHDTIVNVFGLWQNMKEHLPMFQRLKMRPEYAIRLVTCCIPASARIMRFSGSSEHIKTACPSTMKKELRKLHVTWPGYGCSHRIHLRLSHA